MLSLREYLAEQDISKTAFAERLAARLGRRVPKQSVYRWTLPIEDAAYSVPRKNVVQAIEAETSGAVAPSSWYAKPRAARSMAVSVSASRKAAATKRRQREARP